MDRVVLKKGREVSLQRQHPWIFSGSIESIPDCEPGEIFPIYSYDGSYLATGYFHPGHSLCGRVLSFEKGEILPILEKKLEEAIALRAKLFNASQTNAYRLINGEGDGIPGLIVDAYAGHLVVQIHSAGIERLRPFFLDALQKQLSPLSIFEKSTSPSREAEGLDERVESLFGSTPDVVDVVENGIQFLIPIQEGQKTGFFLDQREMRQKVGELAKDRRVLNCFSYTGGFSMYALSKGAKKATSVDVSGKALAIAEKNALKNGLVGHTACKMDVFEFLEKDPLDFDLIILDPPAFAKRRKDLESALKGYERLNRLAFRKMPKNTFLLTASCSHFVKEDQFEECVRRAALKEGRSAQVLLRHLHAPDHPTSLFHKEGGYLKSLLLFAK